MREPETIHNADGRVSVGAIILAAGLSQRMSGVDKTYAPLLGKPLISHSLDTFLKSPCIQRIVLVLAEPNLDRGRSLIDEKGNSEKVSVCAGGARRQDSARCGLTALGECQWVVIHDGARPCIDPDLLERGISHALEHGNAVAAVPVTDTIKAADGEGSVIRTLSRRDLWAVQTPQIFPYSQLKEAYKHVEEEATDDAALVERLGGRVKLYLGSYENIKVTTPQDLSMAELILSRREKTPS